MAFKYFRLAAGVSILGALVGCSSSSSSPGGGNQNTDDDGGTTFHPPAEGGTQNQDDGGGTTNNGDDAGQGPGVGNACATNADCQTVGGVSAQCSNDSSKNGPLFPTPVCIEVGCTAATDPNELAACGDNADPGICQAGPAGDPAVCFPLCSVASNGQISGCLTNDVCQILGTANSGTSAALIGVCQPGCTSTSECPSGSQCDTYQLDCLDSVTLPTKDIGSSCNPQSETDCTCIGPNGSTTGFCTSACVTGTACPQPGALTSGGDGGAEGGAADASAASGSFVCSAQLGGINSLDAGIGFATQPAGLYGFCFQVCNQASDCTTSLGAGATCTPDPAAAPSVGICALAQ